MKRCGGHRASSGRVFAGVKTPAEDQAGLWRHVVRRAGPTIRAISLTTGLARNGAETANGCEFAVVVDGECLGHRWDRWRLQPLLSDQGL